MTVYVDKISDYPVVAEAAKRHGRRWCHMWTDGDLSELHALAAKIGLRREWFQDGQHPHYDLVPSKRALAIEVGAVEREFREYLRLKRASAHISSKTIPQIKRPSK